MSLEIFTGDNLPNVLARVRATLGPDACIVQLKRRGTGFELIASDGTGHFAATPPVHAATPTMSAPAATVQPDFHDLLASQMTTPAPVSTATPLREMPVAAPDPSLPERPGFMVRPWIVALVGPTGTGKTTTIAKLATNPLAFGGCRVGLLGLDTYRVGAVDQLETYADLAGVPVEIVYTGAELTRAMTRLSNCEVVLIDTPGRGPRNAADAETIRGWLKEVAPDEVHLTLTAGQLPDVTRRLVRSYAAFGVTHLLGTKIDEHPGECGIFDVATENDQRMRWITDGQEVPADLRLAADALAAAVARGSRDRFALGVCA